MKIKIPTIGTRGDVQPFIALAQGLEKAGHEVTLLSHPGMRDLVEMHGVVFTPIGPDVDMDAVIDAVQTRSRTAWSGLMQVMRFAFDMLEQSHADILEGCRGADLVVISAGSAAGKNEAEILGLPYASVNLMPWGIHYSEPGRPLFKRILYGAIDGGVNLVTNRPFNNLRRRLNLPPVGPEGFASPRLDLIPVSPTVYRPNPNWSAQHRVTGYWFAEEPIEWQPAKNLVDFLDASPRPLVISLGAMSRGRTRAHETVDLFLAAIQRTGLRAILIGWADVLAEKTLPLSCFSSGPVPFGWLLPHAAGIIHHGGFGTTAAGLRAGLPALVIPHIVDQFTWAQKVYDLGVGPKPISRVKLELSNLSAGMRELVENRVYREAAHELSEQIRSERGIDQAIGLIQSLF